MSLLDVLTNKKSRPDAQDDAPRITTLLEKDHATVKMLFRELRGLDDHDRQEKKRIFSEIDRELTVHATIEEEIFYPAVKGGSSEEGEELVLEAHEEHAIVKTLLSQIRGLAPGDERFDAKLKVLVEAVEHHAGEEEKELFDEADLLGDEKLRELGKKMLKRKEALLERNQPESWQEQAETGTRRGSLPRITRSSRARMKSGKASGTARKSPATRSTSKVRSTSRTKKTITGKSKSVTARAR